MAEKLIKEQMYRVDDLQIIFRDGKLEVMTIDKDLVVQPVVHNRVNIISTKLQDLESTNDFRIKKLGMFWHLQRRHYTGWWIFKKSIWLTEFPFYSMDKKIIYDEYKRLTKQ